MRIQLAANGGLHEPVSPNYPERSLTRSRSLPGGTTDLEQLKAVIANLAKGLYIQLSAKSLSAKNVNLTIALEDSSREVKSTYAKPFRGTLGLQVALLRSLEDLAIEEPIYKITVTLPELVSAKSKQTALAGLPVGETHHTEDALESVRHKFGAYSVHLARDHSEPRRIHVLRAWSNSTGWR